MKTKRSRSIVGIAAALALLAGAGGTVIAGEPAAAQGLVARVIDLHAPNNATQSVTVWVPRATTRSSSHRVATKPLAPRVIDLQASNGTASSITVWTPERLP